MKSDTECELGRRSGSYSQKLGACRIKMDLEPRKDDSGDFGDEMKKYLALRIIEKCLFWTIRLIALN